MARPDTTAGDRGMDPQRPNSGTPDRRTAADGIPDLVEHVRALRRYARGLTGNPVDADDLVQECLARVLAQMRAWREVRDLRAYLFTTLHNVFIDARRRRQNAGAEVPIDDSAGGAIVPAPLVVQASQLVRLEVRDMLSALSTIPSEQREVILLVGLEGMSYHQAAEILGIPIGTVMSRLSRGREALRQLTTQGRPARLRVVK
jgi:RNA polymerase sigma-70 factor (ECF subfamily)